MCELLGRHSLRVFSIHLMLCLLAWGLPVRDGHPLPAAVQVAVLGLSLIGMVLTAWWSERSRDGAPRRGVLTVLQDL